jgi:hypothetical protein
MFPYQNNRDMERMRRAYAMRLLEQASSNAPVQHPLQALARTLQSGLAAHYARQREQEEERPQRYPESDPLASVAQAPTVATFDDTGATPSTSGATPRLPDHPWLAPGPKPANPLPYHGPLNGPIEANPLPLPRLPDGPMEVTPLSFQSPDASTFSTKAAPTTDKTVSNHVGEGEAGNERVVTHVPVQAEGPAAPPSSVSGSDPESARWARERAAIRNRAAVKRNPENLPPEGDTATYPNYVKTRFADSLYLSKAANEANLLADVHGLPRQRNDDPDKSNHHRRNALHHSYTSAILARHHGSKPSESLGNLLEHVTAAIYGRRDPRLARDSWKDLWNNAIGRQIGEYVRQHNLSQYDLEQLIMQAYWRGDLISSMGDSRIPENASGWPRDFTARPTWQGPGSEWRPMEGPGVATIPMPRRWYSKDQPD